MRIKIPDGFKLEAFRCRWLGKNTATNELFDRVLPFAIIRVDSNLERERRQFNEFLGKLADYGILSMQTEPKNIQDHEIDVAFVGSDNASKTVAYNFAKRLLRYALRITVLYGIGNPVTGDIALFNTELGTHIQLRVIDSKRFALDCLCYVMLFLYRRDSDLFLIGVVNAATTYLDSQTQAILNKIRGTNIEPHNGQYRDQKTHLLNLSKSQPELKKFIELADSIHDVRKMHTHRQVTFLSSAMYIVEDSKRTTNKYNRTSQSTLSSSKYPFHEYDYNTIKNVIRDAKKAVRLLKKVHANMNTAGP